MRITVFVTATYQVIRISKHIDRTLIPLELTDNVIMVKSWTAILSNRWQDSNTSAAQHVRKRCNSFPYICGKCLSISM